MKFKHFAIVVMSALSISAPAHADKSYADPNEPKQVGDGKDDLAPLSKGPVEKTPLEKGTFPAPGSEKQGGGSDPVEKGTVDTKKK